MPTGALILLGGLTTVPKFADVMPFDFGSAAHTTQMPFDFIGDPTALTVVMPFTFEGYATKTVVMPFDLGDKSTFTVTMPFDFLGVQSALLPATDLGDGDLVASIPDPTYGWWEGADDEDEDLGTMETD